KQRSLAANAPVDACLVIIPILPRKRPLRPLAPSHLILLRGKLLPPFGVRLRNLLLSHTVLCNTGPCPVRYHPPPRRGSLAPPPSPGYTVLSCFPAATRFDSGSGSEPDRNEWA